MTTRVLGPLDTGGASLSPRERAVLGALIVRRGTVVTPAELAAACWGDEPPRTWPQQVRNAVARIRAKLGTGSVRTVGESYALGLSDASIDADTFERRIADARRHLVEGAPDRAVAMYRSALELWRGDPFPELSGWPPAESEAMRLSQLRTTVEEELLDARLRNGETATAVADAERSVRDEPLREHRWMLLALANYRSDRQVEALAVLRAARTRLVEDLGIDPSRSLLDLEAAILRHDPSLTTPASLAPSAGTPAACPYRGLAAFGVDDAHLFFGRDADAEELLSRCTRGSVVTVVGPSGSGKSSLVRAGLVPLLQERGTSVVVVSPGDLDAAAAPDAFDSAGGVVVLDQAEELLGAPTETIDGTCRHAQAWLQDGGCLVLTLRSDFLDRATALPYIGIAVGRGAYGLSPLDDEGLRRVITAPAEGAGLRVETGLEEVILHDIGDRPGILPALSHALVATWQRREGSTLTIAGYEAGGGIAGAIAQSAERVYRSLSPAAQDACRSVMMRMVERTSEASTLRRRVALSTLTGDPTRRAVVEGLVAARLVTIDGYSAVIAHEAVGHPWPRLDGWLTDDEANARMLRQVEAAAATWEAAGRKEEDLLRGGRLHAALEWREATRPDLTETEAAFLDAAADRHAHEVRVLEERASRETRQNRVLRLTLVAASVMLIAALGASAIAVARTAEAAMAADDARRDALVATSANLIDIDPVVAALLAAEASNRWPDDEQVRQAMAAVAQTSAITRTIEFSDADTIGGAVIPGTRTALVTLSVPGSNDLRKTTAHLLDLDSGAMTHLDDVDVPDGWGTELNISGDGSTAYIGTAIGRDDGDHSACCMSYFTIVDIPSGTTTSDVVLLDARTSTMNAVTHDGARAYFTHPVTGTPSWIERDTGHVVHHTEHDPAEFADAAPLFDGLALIDGELFVAGDDRVEVYDPETLAHLRSIPLPAPDLATRQVAADAEGGVLVFGNAGGARFDLHTEGMSWHQDPNTLQCPIPLALTPGGFICGTGPGYYTEHDLATGAPTGVRIDGISLGGGRVDALPGGAEVAIFVNYEDPSIVIGRLGGDDAEKLAAPELRDRMCALAGRQLTRTEWQTHLGAEPYRNTCPATPGGAAP